MMNRTRLSTLGLAALTFLSLTGFRACGEDPVPIGEDCAADACGAELLAPAIVCDDGSTGGNTGRCVFASSGTCGWEIRECPPPVACAPADCGAMALVAPPPGSHYECATVDAMCAWVLVSDCETADCGPAPASPSFICADGTTGGFTGHCIGAPDGTCGWEVVECPAGECTVDECGPMPGLPTYVCDDGSIGGLAGCSRRADGVCGWDVRECPATTVCGGIAGIACAPGYDCILADGLCLTADAQGTCQARPEICPELFSPVCGCDGMTYGNRCDAAGAGQSVDHTGECGGGFACGDALTCDPSADYCQSFTGGPAGSPTTYECRPLPAACGGAITCETCFDPASDPSGGSCSGDAATGLTYRIAAP